MEYTLLAAQQNMARQAHRRTVENRVRHIQRKTFTEAGPLGNVRDATLNEQIFAFERQRQVFVKNESGAEADPEDAGNEKECREPERPAPRDGRQGYQQKTPPQGRQCRQLLHKQDAAKKGQSGEANG